MCFLKQCIQDLVFKFFLFDFGTDDLVLFFQTSVFTLQRRDVTALIIDATLQKYLWKGQK